MFGVWKWFCEDACILSGCIGDGAVPCVPFASGWLTDVSLLMCSLTRSTCTTSATTMVKKARKQTTHHTAVWRSSPPMLQLLEISMVSYSTSWRWVWILWLFGSDWKSVNIVHLSLFWLNSFCLWDYGWLWNNTLRKTFFWLFGFWFILLFVMMQDLHSQWTSVALGCILYTKEVNTALLIESTKYTVGCYFRV